MQVMDLMTLCPATRGSSMLQCQLQLCSGRHEASEAPHGSQHNQTLITGSTAWLVVSRHRVLLVTVDEWFRCS